MPSTRRSLLSQRLLALITDEWQDVEAFMERAIPLVPPGQASREYQAHHARREADREKRIREGKVMGPRKPVPSEREKLRMGARAIVNSFLGDSRDRRLVEIEALGSRFERRIRLSDERRFSHHCCLHGGSCRGTAETEPEEVAVLPEPEHEVDPLATLIAQVWESRRQREQAAPPVIREVYPGEIDRLLRECG
jgi:hypothetical protein